MVITQEGKVKLEEKLRLLKSKRAEIAEQIRIAREFGDLSENAEYSAAREAQNNLETEIKEVEYELSIAKVLNKKTIDVKTVGVGNVVVLENEKNKVKYTITGHAESDPSNGKISEQSPIGKAICGKAKGDIVEIKVPAGKIKYKITEITVAK